MLPLATALLVSTPQATIVIDPVRDFIQRTLGTLSYKRADADINGDGRKEALIYVTDPAYCGSGGCSLVILSGRGRSYRMVVRTTVTRLPIRLLSTSTHGWRDIGVTVQGGGIARPYEARLRFNGYRYPGNPTIPPAIPLQTTSGKLLIGP